MRIMIAGTGRAAPAERRASVAIDRMLGLPEGRIENLTGVAARAVCGPGESQVSLAEAASRQALDAAGWPRIGLVLGASAVPYQPIPATAPLVMGRLGLPEGSAAAYDVNSTCLSFLTGCEIAARAIVSGQVGAALVFSAEIASRALPWQDAPQVAGLFGDGAAAAVLVATPDGLPGRVAASLMRSYPSGYEACAIGAGGTRFDLAAEPEAFAAHARFAMDGRALFRLAARHFAGFTAELLARAGWVPSEVDLVVPHQASPAGLAHMIRLTGFAPEKVVDISRDHGNQIAASIPFALDMARRQGRLRSGTKLVMLGTSAGVSFGGLAVEV